MKKAVESYDVKDWYLNKKLNEYGLRINTVDGHVFCIIKESEKAVYAMVSLASKIQRTFWIPKSCLETSEKETWVCEDYETAKAEFNAYWSQFC